MNERIRELAEQARQDYLKHHWPTGLSADSVGMYPQLMERFAELIVRECAIFSMVATDDHYDVEALYKHFGIES